MASPVIASSIKVGEWSRAKTALQDICNVKDAFHSGAEPLFASPGRCVGRPFAARL